jgi:predicted DNA-binding transcriptional regulator AlpA
VTPLRPADLPGWPACLSAELAAAYVGLGETSMRALVDQGRFPCPIRLTMGRVGWRRADLDRWIDAGGIDGWRDGRVRNGGPNTR